MLKSEVLEEILEKYREDRLAHAYLIETNNINQAINDLKELIKIINCNYEYTSDCKKCNLCNLISKNNLPSLKIIEPDGTSIKKNQIEHLQKQFETKPIYSKYNTYIVVEAEKLNSSSANSMLKFIEEPTDGILGFFVTTNKDIIIDTIKSRCQIFILNYEDNNMLEDLNIIEDEFNQYISMINLYIEKIKNNNLIINKKDFFSKYTEKKDLDNFFKIMLYCYHEHLLKMNNQHYDNSLIDNFNIEDDYEIVLKQMSIISNIIQEINYNLNLELILDKFIIEMRGSYE